MNPKGTEILEIIKMRRSVREFEPKPIPRDMLACVLEAGRWAPSGLNNQPWRFVIVEDENTKFKLSEMTKYSSIILLAPIALAVFLDKGASYAKNKDLLACGACIQNMLLEIHSLGLGACWLGEILSESANVEKLLNVPGSYELVAVLAIGYPKVDKKEIAQGRVELKELIFGPWPFD